MTPSTPGRPSLPTQGEEGVCMRSHAHDTVTQSSGQVTRRTSASSTQSVPVSGSNTHKQRHTHIHRHTLKTHKQRHTHTHTQNTHSQTHLRGAWALRVRTFITIRGPTGALHTHTSTGRHASYTDIVSQHAASAHVHSEPSPGTAEQVQHCHNMHHQTPTRHPRCNTRI